MRKKQVKKRVRIKRKRITMYYTNKHGEIIKTTYLRRDNPPTQKQLKARKRFGRIASQTKNIKGVAVVNGKKMPKSALYVRNVYRSSTTVSPS